MRTFASLEIRFKYVLIGKLPNRRIIRRKIRSCDSGIRSDREIFPRPSTHTPAGTQLYDAFMVVVRSSVESVPYQPCLEPGTCGVRIIYAIHSPILVGDYSKCQIFRYISLERGIPFQWLTNLHLCINV